MEMSLFLDQYFNFYIKKKMDKEFQKIESSKNQNLRSLEKLRRKKYRKKESKFVIENAKIIVDALRAGYDFSSLFVTDSFFEAKREIVNEITKASSAQELFLLDDKLNKNFSSLDTASGIAAVYEVVEKKLNEGVVLYLNGVSDPGNLGTIMRSALAFGFENLLIDETCAEVFNPKVVAAAKDSIFKLNFIQDKSLKWLRNYDSPIYATSSHKGEALSEFVSAENFCLVLGSESHGVHPDILKLAEKTVKIEMKGEIESLNVAVAGGIILYKLRR